MMMFDPGQTPIRRILFCTDFSENADFAFDFAVDATRRRPGCELHLLHVIPEPDAQFWKTYLYEVDDIDAKARADIDERMEESYLSRMPADVQREVAVRIGRDYAAILDYAKEHRIDLIVMGRQGHSDWGKILFGNVTEKVTRHADCAVLVIPLSYREKIDGE